MRKPDWKQSGFLYAFEEKVCILHNSEKYMFTILYLTQQKKCDIIIKLSHESESQENKGQREP